MGGQTPISLISVLSCGRLPVVSSYFFSAALIAVPGMPGPRCYCQTFVFPFGPRRKNDRKPTLMDKVSPVPFIIISAN